MKGRGLIVHVRNFGTNHVDQTLRFPALKIASANLCNALESDGETIPLTAHDVRISVPARSVAFARVIFEDES